MGIPRLTQDLSGYTEVAVLGAEPTAKDGEVPVSTIAIDGPSLVYHVYDGLLRSLSPAEIASAAVPTYSDVVKGVRSCLDRLKAQGISVEAVLFDGNLPESKRSTRMNRMENMRMQLEDFRKLFPKLQSFENAVSVLAGSPWDARTRPVSNARHTLPPLPFLVPAVLDAAKSSGDMPNVSVVPEEADVACARLARSSGAAILTNDSDLALYDLGPEGCVLILRTLTTTDFSGSLHVSCLRPARIAKRLSLPSLLGLAFERSLDSSVSTSTILRNAKESSMDEEKRLKIDEFQKQFQISEPPANLHTSQSLDPRTSEFVTQASASSESPHAYLPVLHEDPSRDSSWTYGLKYRQLAYSICCSSLSLSGNRGVVEYARKGARIASSSVVIWDDIDMFTRVEGMLEDLDGLVERLRGGWHEGSQHFESVSEWYSAALCIVLQEKLANGRTPLTHKGIDRLFGIDKDGKPEPTFRPTWEDVHLLANAQALLYSWRMLKQILDWTRLHPSTAGGYEAKTMSKDIEKLRVRLEQMPSLGQLFLDLRQMRTCGTPEERANAAAAVKRLIDIQVGTQVRSHARDEGDDIEDENGQRRKQPRVASRSKGNVQSSAKNPFNALADDGEDEEDEDA